MARDIIGPALPPGFQDSDEQDESEQVAGPVLPPGYKFESNSSDSSDNSNQESILETYKQHESSKSERKNRKQGLAEVAIAENETDFFGPALPPGFKRQDDSPQRPIIGPALPPGFRRDSENEDVSDYTFQCQEKKSDESSEDEDTIGPSPASGPVESTVTADIERRAWKMKQKLTEKDDGSNNPIRETWMTELPPELTNYGLGPRTFKRRTNDKSGDRSVWKDTPADREKKSKRKA
ncbi:hypothetical protein GDO86_004202 [Hymenochirus boettgeri]|uniref:GPALPP motifs-containing protein 1 n=1 Tax=Hymenochirus boettgeri TaxID=247094 RepID=A0A8T2K8V9_9PIPI|nr:hypothetical protein GDO86_004202 [Hymenochirus boettgeri]